MRGRWLVGACLVVAVATPLRVDASLVIETTLLGAMQPGDVAVIDTAVATWEALVLDLDGDPATDEAFSITLVKAPQGNVAVTSTHTESEAGLPTGALISFDNGSHFSFFVDPTPASSEEFILIAGAPSTYGVFADPTRFGSVDLFNVILHELGHALGFEEDYSAWAAASDDATATLTFSGQTVGLRGNEDSNALSHLSHVDSPYDLMLSSTFFPGPGGPNHGGFGDRRLVTARDLDVLEGIYGYTVDRGALASIPEPGTLALVAIGLGLLRRVARRNGDRVTPGAVRA